MNANVLFSRRAGSAIAALLAGVGAVGGAGAQTYVVTDMGTLGGPLSGGQGINASGAAVGFAARGDADFHAIIPGVGSGQIDPRAGDRQSHAFAINDLGQVAVMSYDLGEIVPHGLIWQAGVATSLGDMAPRGLNAAGAAAGSHAVLISGLGWMDHPAVWSGGAMSELPTLGGSSGSASGVNDAGMVVGWAWTTGNATEHATAWIGGVAHDLGVLGGSATAKSQAYAVNASGQVVGWSTSSVGTARAFLYVVDVAGNVLSRRDLGVLAGARASYAFGVNSAGDVVGTSGSRAFLWRAGSGGSGIMSDLNTLINPGSGWILERAMGINSAGQIVGSGKLNGLPHGFVLTVRGACGPDFNGDGVLNPDDLSDFIACYFTQVAAPGACAAADYNHDTFVDPDDLADYIAAFFGGC